MSTAATEFSMTNMVTELMDLDPINFIENNLTIKGKRYTAAEGTGLRASGREYLHEILRYICLEAIGPEGLPVVVKKGRQVEMSTLAMGICSFFMCSGQYDHVTGLHGFPQIDQAHRFSNERFDTMIHESVDGRLWQKRAMAVNAKSGETAAERRKATYSVSQKDFVGTNTLYIEGASEEGNRLRNISVDFVLYDEIQDWYTAARENVQEANSHSRFGRQGFGLEMFFGTPKDKKSDFYRMWQSTDQREYHVRCIHCGHFFPITLDNFESGFLIKCQDHEGKGCLELQDKRKAMVHGQWIPTAPENSHIARGYAISQLYIPTITREAIDLKAPDSPDENLRKSPRSFANEVMGDFYTDAFDSMGYADVLRCLTMMELRGGEIQEYSRNLHIAPFIDDQFTWMGIDWGGRVAGEDDQGKGGYTVVIILSQRPDRRLHVEFAKRLEVANIEEQIKEISDYVRRYHVAQIAADFGYGHAQIQLLQAEWGDRVKSVYSTQGAKRSYAFNGDQNMITIDRSQILGEFFESLNQYHFSVPFAEPAKIEWLIEHIANIEITSHTVGGMLRKKYGKRGAANPVDGLMALVYAWTAYKFDRTQGFTNMSINNYGGGNRSMPKPALAQMGPRRSGISARRVIRGGHMRVR